MSDRHGRWTLLVVASSCVVLAVCVIRYAVGHWDGIYDDAFIYLRYVRNLEHDCGVRFNCHGEAVEGFTSPLYLAFLWLGGRATDQLIWLPLLDLVGLTDTAIAQAGRTVPAELLTKQWIGHERHFTEYLLERAPRVIVTTMVCDRAWTSLAEARTGFWADWLLLQAIKAGHAPYHVADLEFRPGHHALVFERN